MHEAYAIIYTTFHVIGALMVIGLVCWQFGKIRARFLWDLEDDVCDIADECLYIAYKRDTSVLPEPPPASALFDLSDIKESVLNESEQVRAYDDGIVFRPSGGTWFYPMSRVQRIWDKSEKRWELPKVRGVRASGGFQ